MLGRPAQRTRTGRPRSLAAPSVPFLFVNQVGGNDDLVFDGHSLVLNAAGECALAMRGFDCDLVYCDLDRLPAVPAPSPVRAALLLDALVLGLRDYMWKSGFRDCVLGLSGGIDSALACYIASRAVGFGWNRR